MPNQLVLKNSTLLFLQGIIMLIDSVLVFITPQESTDEMLLIAGGTSVCMCAIYLAKGLFGEDRSDSIPGLFIALAMCVMAYLFFDHHNISAEWLLVSISGLLLLLALNVFNAAFDMKYIFSYWWMAAVTMLISVGVAYFIVTNKMFPGLSKIVSVYLFMLAMLMIWLGILDRRIEKEYKKTLRELRE